MFSWMTGSGIGIDLTGLEAGLLLAVLGLAAWCFCLHRRWRQLSEGYRRFMCGKTGGQLEEVLLAIGRQQEQNTADIARLREESGNIRRQMDGCLQKVAMVRYNALPELGGEISFAVVLADGNDNGVVLSTVFGRADTRVYGKPLANGRSPYPLTEEEQRAMAGAGIGRN
ncbi:MAG: DUF4446 family protein [Negativicutes bacterium]|nr:DUF4446 family protein [Negativicutes bacterium]